MQRAKAANDEQATKEGIVVGMACKCHWCGCREEDET
jgi:hypothetical protein